ncbi:catalase family peroxidase [Pseudoalteromonas shioyasakiensis]|uniref:catalase family peroxidase n=1 Tax=Pseudoalteromonas shioyasakiensis TaxID=1190813 RepID=UPI002551FF0D|nr:catalase family peroxidase [Pseudoalteromonas shioyasakiensis]MDK9683486.1 catalase family peroxidase [Pseudoalteromonas shioyasakiensis]
MLKIKPLVCAMCLVLPTASFAEQPVNGQDFINLFEKLSGKQPGIRKGHAKGVCAVGTFTPNQAAKQYSISPLFNAPSKANIRFSMGGGNPHADETSRSPRGMGVQFVLENGDVHNIAGLTTPVFAGNSPEAFFGLLSTLVPDEKTGQIDFAKVKAYREQNPSTLGQFNWLQSHNPPASYVSSRYFGVHTFYMVDEKGAKHAFRWIMVPEEPEQVLTEEQMKTFPKSFLAKRLEEDLAKGKVHYRFQAELAEHGDALTDPSVRWPADRKIINLGKLTIESTGESGCDLTNYDPNLLSKGFMPSDDKVLKLRSTAYAISFSKRLTGQ